MPKLSNNLKVAYQKLQRQEVATKQNWQDFVGRDFYKHNIDRYKTDTYKMASLLDWYEDKMERLLRDAEDLIGGKRDGFPRDENERDMHMEHWFNQQRGR